MNTKIELLGIKYYLGLGFLNEFLSGTGKNLNDFESVDNVVLVPQLIYYSRLYACKRNGIDIDFTQEDVFDYIDDNGGVRGKFFSDFYTAYIKAMTEDVPTDEDKKKVKAPKK